ncbi:cation:H+ antiporter [Halopolyspora algeriensis]|uniref:Cation:H+ antiporter n=1 Tax=Halopolyspora algeriensis TaxID=1500506 RepID=A0A368VHS3_9ACTN|nr:cation transporter [Halopolyspora algeriensis]RCW39745.1 cation:H+ antiporter [Halopolyspora algeriensis]TQM56400.1 cation:H+ antiporter [Halopolyspora algeriensis]
MFELLTSPWPLGWSVALFAVAAAVTVAGSVRMAGLGDTLADRTGWGEALFGAVFFGLATSLSGIVMTGVSAATGQVGLAYSNAIGGIAAQTLAVAAADFFYRRSNLEHAAASLSNLSFGTLLITLLATALLAAFSPDYTLWAVHPGSVMLVAFYLGGLRLIQNQGEQPMWRAVRTRETLPDVPEEQDRFAGASNTKLWAQFIVVGGVVAVGGAVIARAAESIVTATGLSAGLVGAVFMGVVNALPETVTAIAAVRRGAATLAIAAVIGGNSLDVLNLVVGDLAYRGGSLYHTAGQDQLFLTAAALLMTTILLGGLLMRQARGWWRLGFEGVLLIGIYAGTVVVLAF